MQEKLTSIRLPVGAQGWLDYYSRLTGADTIGRPIDLGQHPRHMAALMGLGAPVELQVYTTDTGGQKRVVAIAPLTRLTPYRWLKWLSVTHVFRGLIFAQDASEAEKQQVLADLTKLRKRWRWRFMQISPVIENSPRAQTLMRGAGWRQITTGYATAMLDLTPPLDQIRAGLTGKWRNQLVASEKADFEVSHTLDNPKAYDWLIDADNQSAKQAGYATTPRHYIQKYQEMAAFFEPTPTPTPTPTVLALQAFRRREKLAGALFLIHGNTATYQIGWTGQAGRSDNAQNRVLWQAILVLKDLGIEYLDMGGVDSQQLRDVSRFKLGTGAKPCLWVGTFG